ncbi:cytochrome P450 [Mycolicibacterium aubagnense]|nr:cytochrome P450 [Mycolicibacterium aubagnense]TLH49158.1 cytochrome P450 [Mycolicibacterium aubagnense]WGI30791.1 cytochrome P450 [Mycolicibacterium aubagnense]
MSDQSHVDVSSLPLPPVNPLPRRERLAACRSFHTGTDVLRDAGGPVTRFTLAPKWLMPPLVVVTSPHGIRDTVTCHDGSIDKTSDVSQELERILGANLFVVNHEQWKPRRRTIQPVFAKHSVAEFGGHMSEAAQSVCGTWEDGAEIDLDTAARRITMRALGRSVFGLDLADHADLVDAPMRIAVTYAVSRAISPFSLPRWVPTRARRHALKAAATIRGFALNVVGTCRDNPELDAPLVQQLIAAKDPETGKPLSDLDIANELLIFMFAGQDTTATTIAYSLWALGRNRDIQDRVLQEVTQFGERELTPDDVPRLGYTIQVLKESMRLCPPGATGSRMATRDVAVAGYRIPAGTMIVIGRMSVHRDPSLWDRPLVFDPDRFSEENSQGRNRWQYVPFGGGPRGCIGDHFAMLEATLALATIVRHAEIDSVDAEFPMAAPFTLVAGGPIRARIKLR